MMGAGTLIANLNMPAIGRCGFEPSAMAQGSLKLTAFMDYIITTLRAFQQTIPDIKRSFRKKKRLFMNTGMCSEIRILSSLKVIFLNEYLRHGIMKVMWAGEERSIPFRQ